MSGKKSEKIGKKEEESGKKRQKFGRVLSLCPSWQTGLAKLLVIKQWLSNLLLICKFGQLNAYLQLCSIISALNGVHQSSGFDQRCKALKEILCSIFMDCTISVFMVGSILRNPKFSVLPHLSDALSDTVKLNQNIVDLIIRNIP